LNSVTSMPWQQNEGRRTDNCVNKKYSGHTISHSNYNTSPDRRHQFTRKTKDPFCFGP
jgi:hypothetical protein